VYGIKTSVMAQKTGIPVSTLNDWRKGGTPQNHTWKEKLMRFLEKEIGGRLDAEQLLQLEACNTGFLVPAMLRIYLNRKRMALPVFNNEIRPAGTIVQFGNDIDLFVDHLYAACFGKVDGAVCVQTDSMCPTFHPQAKIVIRRLPYPELMHPGYPYYFLDSNGDTLIRRIKNVNTKKIILLNSENKKKYPDIEWRMDPFLAICEIRETVSQVDYFRQAYSG
jgi:hypothetical protein